MVNVKSLLFAASALLSGIAAAPFPSSGLEAHATDTVAVESRHLNAPHGLERRTLARGQTTTPMDMRENQWIYGSSVKRQNLDAIAITDLSGCTVLVFWDKDWWPSAFHLLCGNEEADAQEAYSRIDEMGGGLDDNGISIAYSHQQYLDATIRGLKAYNPDAERKIINRQFYDWANIKSLRPGNRVTMTIHRGSNVLQQTDAPGTSNQPGGK
ncbi:uncharacterized protein BDR25DRAFT_10860 [Lindgomyces ingoldianus]|uniref:Uncharacterized protein n=1 Tax=Lindgomyces ingoldianus TaxID=673940 RepID=A0ACB6R2W4_9PLEO|nr:uncharacterized protein BDR25DRAFT_10860 [Lindgomyces ingoldianus]KAF2472670.1 hypothetical protein BDR25DRAFT_10860 [Lindgomyces ingoldianus]